MKLQLAGEQDIDEIEALMRRTEQQMENPEWFVADDRDFIRRHIQEEGRTVIARSDSSRLAGFFILRFPGAAEDNLSRDIPGIACLLEEAVHMESATVDPAFRGQGLQRAMAAYGERITGRPWEFDSHSPQCIRITGQVLQVCSGRALTSRRRRRSTAAECVTFW